jgi:DNA-binding GntR family transcriptional regulator
MAISLSLQSWPPSADGSSRAQQAYEYVRDRILRGYFPVGSVIADVDVAAALGMSKTPVRQALRLLEQEGLLERGKRRQLRVRAFSADEREEIVEVRDALGAIAVRAACRSMSTDEVDLLRFSLLRQTRAAQQGDEDEFIELDEEFHVLLSAHAPIVLGFLKHLRGFIRVMRLGSVRREGYLLEVLAEHEAIVDAIEARDEQAAVAAFSRHVHTTEYPVE